MNIIYPYTIDVDKGRLPKRGKYGKISGWEQVQKRNIWENSCLRTVTLTDSKVFCEDSSLRKGKLQA
jgi:hypothetical protein